MSFRKLPAKERENREILIETALDEGKAISYKDLVKSTGLTKRQVEYTLQKNEELHHKFKKNLARLKITAATNLTEFLEHDDEKIRLDATKFFLSKWRSDFDEMFQRVDGSGMSIEAYNDEVNQRKAITINFRVQDGSD